MGIDPDAPEPVDPAEVQAERARRRNEGFRKICSACGCTPRQLADVPLDVVIEKIRECEGEEQARRADRSILPGLIRAFIESSG